MLALYHLIKIELGQEKQFVNGDKKEIEVIGRNKYNLEDGQSFYRSIKAINLLNMPVFIQSLRKADRSKWKEIITELSGNNAEIINWLKKQPN